MCFPISRHRNFQLANTFFTFSCVIVDHSSFIAFQRPSIVVDLLLKRRCFRYPKLKKSRGLASGDFTGMSMLAIKFIPISTCSHFLPAGSAGFPPRQHRHVPRGPAPKGALAPEARDLFFFSFYNNGRQVGLFGKRAPNAWCLGPRAKGAGAPVMIGPVMKGPWAPAMTGLDPWGPP